MEKPLISSLMRKIPYFRVFPLFGGIICQMILFSNFLSKFFNGKQNLVKLFCGQTRDIHIETAPNSSNETCTFMGLGRAGRFGQS